MSGETQKTTETQLDGLWVEIAATGPAEATWAQTRVIYDRAMRPDAQMLARWDMAVLPGPLSLAWLDHIDMRALATMGPVLADIARGKVAPGSRKVMELASYAPNGAHAFSIMRQARLAALLEGMPAKKRPAVLWSTASVLVAKRELEVTAEDAMNRRFLDIVTGGVELLRRDEALTADVATNLRLGVTDTGLEELMVPPCGDDGTHHGTVSFFERRELEGRGGTVVVRNEQDALAGAAMPEHTRGWIAQAAPAGSVAVIPAEWSPEDGDSFYWWSVDPATGRTLGRTWDGGGQAMVEYASEIYLALGAVLCVVGLFSNGNGAQYACCGLLAMAGYVYVAGFALNTALFWYGYAASGTAVPSVGGFQMENLDPCYWVGQMFGGGEDG